MLTLPKNVSDTSDMREVEIAGRIPPIDSLSIKLSPSECTNLGFAAQEFKRKSEEELIQKTVGAETLKEAEIATRTKIHATTLRKRLKSLHQKGQMDFKPLPGKGTPKGWFNVVGSPANETTDGKTLDCLAGLPTETIN